MLTSNYTSIDRILERIHLDYGFSLNRYEVGEWLWSIMGNLGIPGAFDHKYIDTIVDDYRTGLPIDCYKLENIKYTATGDLLVKSLDVFHRANKTTTSSASESATYFEGPTVVVDGRTHDDQASVFVSEGGTTGIPYYDQLTYQEYNGNIYYGFKKGDIQIHYTAFPIEEDGMPKIPDDSKYIEAVLLGLLVKHLTKLHFKGQITSQVLNEYKTEYAFAAGAAIGKSKMPDVDTMESIKRMQMRLIPIMTQHSSGFKYANSTERLRKV